MSGADSDVRALLELDDDALWAELGRSVQQDGLGMLPEELDRKPTDEQAGRWFFNRQIANIKRIYCTESVAMLVQEEKRRDVVEFVASLIDLFAAYFGAVPGTIILVKIYKIGVDRFCSHTPAT